MKIKKIFVITVASLMLIAGNTLNNNFELSTAKANEENTVDKVTGNDNKEEKLYNLNTGLQIRTIADGWVAVPGATITLTNNDTGKVVHTYTVDDSGRAGADYNEGTNFPKGNYTLTVTNLPTGGILSGRKYHWSGNNSATFKLDGARSLPFHLIEDLIIETRFLDTNGKQILPNEEGEVDKKDIDEYEYKETKKHYSREDKKAYQDFIYEKIIMTRFQDSSGKDLVAKEKGIKDKKEIDGYTFWKTKIEDDGDTIHIYKKNIFTKFVDSNGKEIAPQVKGFKDKIEIKGYTYVETKKDKDGNTTHTYKKNIVTRFVDKDGKDIIEKVNGFKDKIEIKGYTYVETKKDKDGNTTHIYKKNPESKVAKAKKIEKTKNSSPKTGVSGLSLTTSILAAASTALIALIKKNR